MNKKISIIDIFIAFLKSGTILLGGGYIILPILQSELVKKRMWLSEEELTDYYAISQSLPGLISINIAILTGYKLRGVLGAFSGVIGITFSAFWAIILLSSILAQFTSNTYVQSAFWGIGIAVVVLIISAVREMWDKSVTNIKTFILYLIALTIMLITKISPAYVIIGAIILGIGYKTIERRFEQK